MDVEETKIEENSEVKIAEIYNREYYDNVINEFLKLGEELDISIYNSANRIIDDMFSCLFGYKYLWKQISPYDHSNHNKHRPYQSFVLHFLRQLADMI